MGCSSVSAAAIILSAIVTSLQVSPCGAFQFVFSDSFRVHSCCRHLIMPAAASSSEWLYDIPNSSWTSAEWNWGYASGTGHDCAAICRGKFATRSSRAEFVRSLLDPSSTSTQPPSFEEVKLVLGLAVQRGRRDGSDGGPGGYGDVLAAMASAHRYETDGTEENRMMNFVDDMKHRFGKLNPSKEDAEMMKSLDGCNGGANIDELDAARRICSGLVLKNMGFIDNGL